LHQFTVFSPKRISDSECPESPWLGREQRELLLYSLRGEPEVLITHKDDFLLITSHKFMGVMGTEGAGFLRKAPKDFRSGEDRIPRHSI